MWSHRGPNNSTTWILGLWHFNFNSGIGAIGKTRVAPNTSKTGTAWWVASNQKSYIFRCTTQCKAGSGPKHAILAQPSLPQRSGLTWTQSKMQFLERCHFNFNSGVGVIGKTRVSPKTSKKNTAWWLALALNLRKLPVAMNSQINNQIGKAEARKQKTNLEILGETGRYLQLCSFTVLHGYLFRTILDHGGW